MANKRKICEYSDIESSSDELEFEVYTERDINNIDAVSRDNADNIEVSYESDSNESNIFPVARRYISRIDSEIESSESDSGENVEDTAGSSGNDEWIDVSEVDNIPSHMDFDISPRIAGPQISNEIKEPLDFFQLYFTDDLIDSIVKETNDYANSKLRETQLSKRSIWHTWTEVNRKEFLAFIGVILNMGTMPVPNLQEYWSTKFTSKIPFYSDVFTRDRFLQIFWMLHLHKKTPKGSHACLRTRVQKVDNFLQYINSKFSEHFIPYQSIRVDESIITFKGKICFMSYPAKPTKWEIRIYVLADSNTGYVYSVLPYYGSMNTEDLIRPDLPVSSRIPLDLYRKLLDNIPNAKGYHMYTDSHYTSIPLAEELLKLNCFLTGTIKTNRKYLPMLIKKLQFVKDRRKTVAYRKGKALVLAWKDKRIVTLLSTRSKAGLTLVHRRVRGRELVRIQRPKIIIDYTKNMRGVNRVNQYAATYCFLRKSLKWWRKLFFWGMEMCTVNSYILYTSAKKLNDEKPMSHLKFVKSLVGQLVGNFRQNSTSREYTYTPNTEGRLNNHLHIVRSGTKRDCVVCSNRKIPGERRQTHYFCDTCLEKPRLHIGNCFERYHTLENYKM